MSLLTILRGGVATLNRITRSGNLQAVVMYAHPATPGVSDPAYLPATPLHAIVDDKTTQMRTLEGTVITVRTVLTLVDISEVVAATSGAGVSNDGVFTLPDGRVGPILALDGFVDAETGRKIATTVGLG